MSKIEKPTTDQLAYWDELLTPGRKSPAKPVTPRFESRLDESTGANVPAQPVRNGGMLWRERVFINDRKQDRKKKPRLAKTCKSCGRGFNGTLRAVYCSTKCRMRAFRSGTRYAKLPIHSEGNAQ